MSRKIIFYILLGFMITSCSQGKNESVSEESRLKLANAYYTNGLYTAAVDEYLAYIRDSKPDASRSANTYYTIANIYFDRIGDYGKALEFYFKVKYLFPESSLQGDVGKQIVSCLERLKRSTDAARIYEQEAALDKSTVKEHRDGAVLAKIGSRELTQGDLDFEISKMPAYVREQFSDKNKKREFLKQYILQELLYDSAKRQGFDQEKDVIEGTFRAQKSLMAEKLLQKEMESQIKKIEPADVELYYKANKENYTEKDKDGKIIGQKPFSEVRQQAAQDLAMEKQQQAYQSLADRLMKAQKVQIYENRIQ
ncbi:MAG: hypothetical protein AB7T22_05570 [Calditrichaceae bacterium]